MITQAVINGLTIGTWASGYLFKRLGGFDMPEATIEVKGRGSYHGALIGNKFYGRRIMSIEGEIIGDDAADYEEKRRALQDALDLIDGVQTVVFTTRGGLVVRADVVINRKVEMPYVAGQVIRGDFRIEFISQYPFLLGNVEQVEEITIGAGGGGAIPMAVPFSLANGATGGTVITNDGNAPAYPTIRIYGAIQNPTLTNQTTGKTLSITYTLSSDTDYIDIDIYNRTAKNASGATIKRYVTGDWWTLAVGANTIKLSGSAESPSHKAEITFRDSYLGL